MRVIVIGAGVAGLTAAYQLCKSGAKVDVFEASNRIGGMAASFDLWGQRVDLGPHRFFSADPLVNEFWKSVAGKEYRTVRRLTRIYYNHRFFYYPLRPFDAFCKLGLISSFLCAASYLWAKIHLPAKEKQETFEEWVSRRFGRRLYTIFFKTYSEKLWGIPCHDLDADFAAQRIKNFSLGEAVRAMFSAKTSSRHATLVDQFMYPLKGTGSIYEKMASAIKRNGGTIHLSSPVSRILTENGRACGVELAGGGKIFADEVISSMPVTLVAAGLDGAPSEVLDACSKLHYRNTILVYLKVANDNLFPDNWLYVHSPDLKSGRITNFRNWIPELYGDSRESIVVLEYWCCDTDAIWAEPDEELVSRATKEFRMTGLDRGAAINGGHVERLHRSYPVYALGYRDSLAKITRYIRTIQHLSCIGRYGTFKYNNQDHSILMGILAAENVLHCAQHDLWSVNTGDLYQEAAAVKDDRSR